MSTPPFADIARAIHDHENFMIAAHVGPDGDAIGSGLALKFALESLGKHAVVISHDGVPQSCRFLPRHDEVLRSVPGDFAREFKLQCAFILDCDGTPDRVAAPYRLIETAPCRVLIDHHRSSRPIFETNWIDVSQPATALMIFDLIEHLKIPITPDIAQCLLCGLSTDTGHFHFSNTTPHALRAAARLVECGADSDLIAFKLFDERSRESTHLLGLALSKMQSACDGQLMWTAVEAKDFEIAGAGDEASENIVNFLRNVRGVRMALIFRERHDETGIVTRISIRCEQSLRADLFAGQFGGGGHAAAAGCRVRRKPFEESVQLVVEAARKWIEEETAA
jgi:phosphoesterase RecJ-like protein